MTKPIESQRIYLPTPSTTFIGRTIELSQIAKLLSDSACRLLTIVGAGGMGKTRLAIQVAATLTDQYKQGVYFASLQGIYDREFLVSAIAEAIDFSLSGHQTPLDQILNYLSDKNSLLILDNFEQLIEQDGLTILTELLVAAPQLKVIVTSREVLNLQEEWLYSLQGLPVSETFKQGAASDLDDAIQLFFSRARQVRPEISLDDQLEAVQRICQLVEGIPLAIELAASWTKTLSCQAIATEIQQSLDFLVTPLRNIPERHQSMAAVFETSWQLLSDREQTIFKQLSVFRGGFQRDAAAHVAGATLPDLAGLVDKSLLRREANDRYQIHELLRQYSQDQLQVEAQMLQHTYQAHCDYYAEFLHQRADALEAGDQQGALFEIEAELENVRAAWRWAINNGQVVAIHKMTQAFMIFCYYQSRYLEAATTFAQARDALLAQPPSRETDLILANVLVRIGWMHIPLGNFEAAQTALTESQRLLDRYDAAPENHSGTDPLPPLSILATIRGEFDEAVRLGQTSRQANQVRNHQQNLAFSHYVLTSAWLAQGNYDVARQQAQQACEVSEQIGNRWFLAFCLNEWGNVARAMGDYAEAKRHFQKSYHIRKAFNDPVGMAVALNLLGEMAIRQREFLEAQQRYQESVTIFQENNDRGGLATALNGLGQTACALEDYSGAIQQFQLALTIARDIQFLPLIYAMFISVSELFLKMGLSETTLDLLTFIRDYPAADQEIKDRAIQMLSHDHSTSKADAFLATSQSDPSTDFEMMLVKIEQTLTRIANQPPPKPINPTQPLFDPLTDRELEVLQLMAAGRSNRQISEELVLALGSVKWYASQIYSKLQVKNRTEAAAKARTLGLL
ncbi:MAG: tetratricopeptide repeat protein [Chloroflexota bacterium]